MQTEKTSSEDAAVEISADFALHEASDGRAVFPRIGEECLEVVSDDFVEERLLRLVALVAGLIDDHVDPVRDRVGVRGSV